MRYLDEERSPDKVKRGTAGRDSRCPQCKEPIFMGEVIGQPQEKNELGGQRFKSVWYCEPCAELAQSQTYAKVAASPDCYPGWKQSRTKPTLAELIGKVQS